MYNTRNTLSQYIKEIEQFPLLNNDEEKALGEKVVHGDEKALEKLIQSNLRLVIKIAHEFKGYGVPLNEIVAEGNLGLIKAAKRFDPDKGAKFSTYSAIWIKQAMRICLAKLSKTVRVPISSMSKFCKIREACLKLKEKLNRSPGDTEVADYLRMPVKTVENLRNLKFACYSLNKKLKNESGIGQIQDMLEEQREELQPDQNILKEELADSITRHWHCLNERQQYVLEHRYGLGNKPIKTLHEISDLLEISGERVRQIQVDALHKLKKQIRREESDN